MLKLKGGHILIGVNDVERKIVGIPLTENQKEAFILMVERLTHDFHPILLPE